MCCCGVILLYYIDAIELLINIVTNRSTTHRGKSQRYGKSNTGDNYLICWHSGR